LANRTAFSFRKYKDEALQNLQSQERYKIFVLFLLLPLYLARNCGPNRNKTIWYLTYYTLHHRILFKVFKLLIILLNISTLKSSIHFHLQLFRNKEMLNIVFSLIGLFCIFQKYALENLNTGKTASSREVWLMQTKFRRLRR
jgi:hypothetical protein